MCFLHFFFFNPALMEFVFLPPISRHTRPREKSRLVHVLMLSCMLYIYSMYHMYVGYIGRYIPLLVSMLRASPEVTIYTYQICYYTSIFGGGNSSLGSRYTSRHRRGGGGKTRIRFRIKYRLPNFDGIHYNM